MSASYSVRDSIIATYKTPLLTPFAYQNLHTHNNNKHTQTSNAGHTHLSINYQHVTYQITRIAFRAPPRVEKTSIGHFRETGPIRQHARRRTRRCAGFRTSQSSEEPGQLVNISSARTQL